MLNLVALIGTASAQVTLTGTNYTQNFNDLGSGLPPGWSVRTGADTNSLGAEVTLTTNATSWGTLTGQFANYASTVSNNGTNLLGGESSTAQGTCTNRSLGVRQTGSFGDPGAAFVLQLQNTRGFTGLQLSLDCNMLSVQTRSTTWTIDYGLGSDPTNFVALETYPDPGAFGTTVKTVSFPTALDDQGQNVWIRIAALESATGANRCDTIGIDNVQLNYSAAAVVSPIPLNIQLQGNKAVLTWSSSAFSLQAAPSAADTFTNVPGAASPYTNPITEPQMFFRLKTK